jgi:thiol-disulfide isomerase/thioredoxin
MSKSDNPIFIILMFILVIIIFLAIFRTVTPFLTMGLGINANIGSLKGSFQFEAFDNKESEEPTFVFFYIKNCHWCDEARWEFKILKKKYNGNIKIIEIDAAASENKELVKNSKIKGYPTFKYFSNGLNGSSEEYNGRNNSDDFIEFLSNK